MVASTINGSGLLAGGESWFVMAKQECPLLIDCPIFERFRSEGLKNIWINRYCRGSKADTCARKKLREAGKDVPITLLPNDTHLDSLA